MANEQVLSEFDRNVADDQIERFVERIQNVLDAHGVLTVADYQAARPEALDSAPTTPANKPLLGEYDRIVEFYEIRGLVERIQGVLDAHGVLTVADYQRELQAARNDAGAEPRGLEREPGTSS